MISILHTNECSMGTMRRALVRRLENKGLDSSSIPGYMRSLSNALDKKPHMTLNQVNRQMDYVGWRGVELDYRTWELTRTALEHEKASSLNLKAACW